MPDSDEEDAFDEAREGEDDSGDELARQLMQKATLGGDGAAAAGTSTAATKGKGKGKAAPVPVEDAIAPPMPRPPVPAAPAPSASSDAPAPVITVLASLHLYDRATGLFMLQDDFVKASLYKLGPASTAKGYWLVVESASAPQGEGKDKKDEAADVWVSQAITAETTVNFAEKERAMVFNYTAPPEPDSQQQPGWTYTWLLRLPTDEAFGALQASVSAALFEDKWGAGSWSKLKEDDREYARKAWLEEDAEMWDANEEDEQAEEAEDDEDEESEEDEPEPAPESDDDEYDSGAFACPPGSPNSPNTDIAASQTTKSAPRPPRAPSPRSAPLARRSAPRSARRTRRSRSGTRRTCRSSCRGT